MHIQNIYGLMVFKLVWVIVVCLSIMLGNKMSRRNLRLLSCVALHLKTFSIYAVGIFNLKCWNFLFMWKSGILWFCRIFCLVFHSAWSKKMAAISNLLFYHGNIRLSSITLNLTLNSSFFPDSIRYHISYQWWMFPFQ